MQAVREYLLSYGTVGDFGRFRPRKPLSCSRGDRAVVRSHRGVELATVLCEAAPGHALFLPNTTVGELLRLATAEDDCAAEHARQRARQICEVARQLAEDLGLPLAVLDVEILLDDQHAIIQYLGSDEFDARPFVSRLSMQFEVQVALQDLSAPRESLAADAGCGRPDCGKAEGGGCDTCGTGGCSTCGSGDPNDVQSYFASLREKMTKAVRTPLL